MDDFSIGYQTIMQDSPASDYDGAVDWILENVISAWVKAYEAMGGDPNRILTFPDGSGFEFMFDDAPKVEGDDKAVHPRVVAAYGRSIYTDVKRDASRIAGFVGGPIKAPRPGEGNVPLDKGHFIAHTMGGLLDVNLFPQRQRRDVNRGWSERGKVYRKMERYCAEHPTTFCFSRPIYRDHTWRPHELDYGILLEATRLWVETFDN